MGIDDELIGMIESRWAAFDSSFFDSSGGGDTGTEVEGRIVDEMFFVADCGGFSGCGCAGAPCAAAAGCALDIRGRFSPRGEAGGD